MQLSENIIPEIQPQINNLYGTQTTDYEVFGNNENLVFGSREAVFRLVTGNHRTPEELDSEVELLDILDRNRCSVVQILASQDGNKYKKIRTSVGELHVIAFRYLDGVGEVDSFDDSMIETWGESMGKIHAVTARSDLQKAGNRLQWDEEVIFERSDFLLPDEESNVRNVLSATLEEVRSFEKSDHVFGLTHTDMRPRNFSYKSGQIAHFDFDDICHHWFVFDLAATALHEAEQFQSQEERTEFLQHFFDTFLEGYTKERKISKTEMDTIWVLMKLRCIYAYIDYYKRLKIKGVDSGHEKMLMRKGFVLDFDTFADKEKIQNILSKHIG